MLHGEVKNLMPTVTTNQLPVCTNQELIAREKNHPFSLFLQMCILRICYHEIRLLVRTNQQSIRGENFLPSESTLVLDFFLPSNRLPVGANQ